MVLSKFSQLSILALALATPALACVQYSCNLNNGNQLFNAALTDNGGQTCQAVNVYLGNRTLAADNYVVDLSCIAGYSASFSFITQAVTYQYGSFEGSFDTTNSSYPDGGGTYYTANVWGC